MLQKHWPIKVMKVTNSPQTVMAFRVQTEGNISWTYSLNRNPRKVVLPTVPSSPAPLLTHSILICSWVGTNTYKSIFPCLSLTCFLSGNVFCYFWTLWCATSNWILTSDFLSENLGLKYLPGSWAPLQTVPRVGYPKLQYVSWSLLVPSSPAMVPPPGHVRSRNKCFLVPYQFKLDLLLYHNIVLSLLANFNLKKICRKTWWSPNTLSSEALE